ncbi:helix-turn-helix transcriptional regulator [Sphingomonas ginsenosidivorax]|uniref:Helix-turn-helix transcriptional regulator n=1 Tax=Sphingomonas ginsenosidivorax TaxID=862135 RepID=A0A5C6UC79_9SPHN|nr:helix-turn-helix domain-containing protein [Sphingomonas ginsenosidivorax]TXC70312.1 helix-turn-helix transcriptional regulator [Sphingomonas ginsenosidivorax]
MKLENVTGDGAGPAKRWYDDACGTAHALELVGERWSLLIVRELMFGPRRFGELRAALPGISANTLTQRLDGLAAAGIARREKLPPPASVQVYGLTPWGYEAEDAIQALGRWAARSPGHDPTLPISPASLMLSFRTMFRGSDGWRAAIGFRFDHEAFVVRVGGTLDVTREDPAAADVVLAADPPMIAALVYGKVPLDQLPIAVTGSTDAACRFVDLFALPPKAPRA